MDNYSIYIGTYTSKHSEGIYFDGWEEDPRKLKFQKLAAKVENPSYLIFSANHKFAYSVVETKEFQGENGGALAAFSVEATTGKLQLLNIMGTKGKDPCHLCIDAKGKYLHAANYSEGAITSYKINDDGSLGELYSFIKHEGHGPNVVRQEMPHVHFVTYSLDEKYLCAVDLGLDKIFFYAFDSNTGALSYNDNLSINVKLGAGPRHFVFDEKGEFIYLINELSSEIAVLKYSKEAEKFQALQYISTLPSGFKEENICAAIKLSKNNKFIYASNRGHNSIAVFKIVDNGQLELVDIYSTKGNWTRDFALAPDGKYILAANEKSNNIVSFKVNVETGELEEAVEVAKIHSPVYIDFIKSN